MIMYSHHLFRWFSFWFAVLISKSNSYTLAAARARGDFVIYFCSWKEMLWFHDIIYTKKFIDLCLWSIWMYRAILMIFTLTFSTAWRRYRHRRVSWINPLLVVNFYLAHSTVIIIISGRIRYIPWFPPRIRMTLLLSSKHRYLCNIKHC